MGYLNRSRILFSLCDICGLQIQEALRSVPVASAKRSEMLNSISKVAADQAEAREILDAAAIA